MELEDLSPYQQPLVPVYVIRFYLEGALETWVTRRKTKRPILFRGERRYLKPLPTDAVHRDRILYANLALQSLYEFEDAFQRGKIDSALRSAFAFTESYRDFGALKSGGLDSLRLTIGAIQDRARRRKGAETVNADHLELHAQYQPKVDELMAAGVSYTAASEEVARFFGLKSGRTVRNHTKNLNPRNRRKRRVGNR